MSNEKGAETVSVNILSSETVIGTGALEATILENDLKSPLGKLLITPTASV